jgi:hypothetical protein
LDAGAHHLVNLLLHIANTLLLFGILKRMTRAHWRSALVAALFALHPLHAQSVAWVTGLKDVLSMFFGLLTIWAYTEYVNRLNGLNVEPFEGEIKSSRDPSQVRTLFQQVNLEPLIGQAQGAGHPGHASANDQSLLSTGSWNSCNGSKRAVRATAIRTMSFAFCVASSFSLEWTQEQCSLMLAISKK